jgi:N-acetylglutamate synthase-like GNAT family acetyltransferase
MKIRRIKESEAAAASKIVGINYSREYQKRSKKEIEAMFRNYVYKPEYLVAEDNGKIIGLAGCIESWMDYRVYQIFWVNVLPEHQNRGTGTQLVEKLHRENKEKEGSTFRTDKHRQADVL